MSGQRGLGDETISIRNQDKIYIENDYKLWIFQPITKVTITLVCSFMFACQNAPTENVAELPPKKVDDMRYPLENRKKQCGQRTYLCSVMFVFLLFLHEGEDMIWRPASYTKGWTKV